MIDHIDETLAQWRSTPFEWGKRDCLLSIADYVASRTGEDWGDRFRGTYDNEAGAIAHIKNYGGEEYLIDRSGLQWTRKPVRGDIVLFQLGDDERKYAAICTGDAVAVRMEKGVKEISMKFTTILCAWKVP